METILTIALLISGILQIILFFKLWGMTNKVKDIYTIMYRQKVDAGDLNFNEFVEYLETNIRLAKRMKASGDERLDIVLNGLKYDVENYFDNSNPYQSKIANKYKQTINEVATI